MRHATVAIWPAKFPATPGGEQRQLPVHEFVPGTGFQAIPPSHSKSHVPHSDAALEELPLDPDESPLEPLDPELSPLLADEPDSVDEPLDPDEPDEDDTELPDWTDDSLLLDEPEESDEPLLPTLEPDDPDD